MWFRTSFLANRDQYRWSLLLIQDALKWQGEHLSNFAYMSYLCVIFRLSGWITLSLNLPMTGETHILTYWATPRSNYTAYQMTCGTHHCPDMPPPTWQIGPAPPCWQAGPAPATWQKYPPPTKYFAKRELQRVRTRDLLCTHLRSNHCGTTRARVGLATRKPLNII
jgi:hypothetical protein